MKKIHNAEFGFAMFLAIDFAMAIQTQQDKSNLDWAKDEPGSAAEAGAKACALFILNNEVEIE